MDRSSAKEHEWEKREKKTTHVSRPIEWGIARFLPNGDCDTNSQIVAIDKRNATEWCDRAKGRRLLEREKGVFEMFPGKRCGKREEGVVNH